MIAKMCAALLGCLLLSSLTAAERPTATVDGKTYPIYDANTEAQPLKRVAPDMPYAAMQAGRGGTATVGAVINEKGKVKKAYIVEAEAEGDIRAAMVNAVKETVFPIMRDPGSQAAISYVTMIKMELRASPAREPVVSPKLVEIIADPKFLRGALGIKALLYSDPKTGEVAPELLADVKAAGLTEGIQFFPLPKEATHPEPKSRVAPVYPQELQRKQVSGQVRFLCALGTDGTVKGLYCTATSRPEFAPAAAVAIVQWRFEPARIQNTPVPILVNVTLAFGAD